MTRLGPRARHGGLRPWVVTLALAACTAAEPPSTPAPPFALPALDGGTISLEGLRGKLVLLDFWATWCAPCVVEIPELNAFYASHRERGVELVAISVDEIPPEEVRAFAKEHGITYPVALASLEVAEAYGATSFPFHVLISRDGEVLERLSPGYHDREELAELIARHDG